MKNQIKVLKNKAESYKGSANNMSRFLKLVSVELGIVSDEGCPQGNYVSHNGKLYGITFVSSDLKLNKKKQYRQFYKDQEGLIAIDLDTFKVFEFSVEDLDISESPNRIKVDGTKAYTAKFTY